MNETVWNTISRFEDLSPNNKDIIIEEIFESTWCDQITDITFNRADIIPHMEEIVQGKKMRCGIWSAQIVSLFLWIKENIKIQAIIQHYLNNNGTNDLYIFLWFLQNTITPVQTTLANTWNIITSYLIKEILTADKLLNRNSDIDERFWRTPKDLERIMNQAHPNYEAVYTSYLHLNEITKSLADWIPVVVLFADLSTKNPWREAYWSNEVTSNTIMHYAVVIDIDDSQKHITVLNPFWIQEVYNRQDFLRRRSFDASYLKNMPLSHRLWVKLSHPNTWIVFSKKTN